MSNRMVDYFESFRTTLCVCPCCGDIVRLSDLTLNFKGKTGATWLDLYDRAVRQLEKKEERFDEEEQALRDAATARGRMKVPLMVRKSLKKEFACLKTRVLNLMASRVCLLADEVNQGVKLYLEIERSLRTNKSGKSYASAELFKRGIQNEIVSQGHQKLIEISKKG